MTANTTKTPVRSNAVANNAASNSTDDMLRHLAFDNSLLANIISTASTGNIVMANGAARKLLGYSKKEILTKSRSTIFDIKEDSFKEMLKQRTAEGHSIALVTAIKKSGKTIPCQITSAVFLDEDGIEKAITTITDISGSILKQKEIDKEKEKIVADNIAQGRSAQKEIDTTKDKIVADNITEAKSKQKIIDLKNEKTVAGNIAMAKSKQEKIDIKKEKIVAGNIILAQEKSDSLLADNTEWIKYIAKTSYDVMWDWDIITGDVYVGDSIEEVFGYKVPDNTVKFSDLTNGLLENENNSVRENLMSILGSGKKNWNDSYKIRRKDGSIASVTSRGSIIRDNEGKAVRMIGATQDVSKVHDLEMKLEDHVTAIAGYNKIFNLASGISFDVIWDWNLLTDELYMGEGFEELFGYSMTNNKGHIADWTTHIHPDDKEAVEKGIYEAITSPTETRRALSYRYIRADGTIARVYDRASIIRHADGKAYRMLGAMKDMTRQTELEEKLDHELFIRGKLLAEFKNSFKFIFNKSSDVFFDSDLVTDEVMISEAYDKEFGYKISGHMTPEKDWISHIHPGDKEAVITDYRRALASEESEWKYNYRFLKGDDSVIFVTTTGTILRNPDGKPYRMIGSMQDTSKQTKPEESMILEIRLKEKQIEEALEEARQTERSDIGKELHDNVNQLLIASKLYLDLAKRGGENSEMYLTRSSQYTLTAIEEIRKLTKGLTTDIIKNLGLVDAIDNMVQDTMEISPVKISSSVKGFQEKTVDDKFKLNVFRIIQEQLNNILKHAQATEVVISLLQNKKSITLAISDNGIGFDTSKTPKGIGIANIKSRAATYNGKAEFVSELTKGCILTVSFPLDATLIKKS
jgi:PAS domain S-box-containing protein